MTAVERADGGWFCKKCGCGIVASTGITVTSFTCLCKPKPQLTVVKGGKP